MATFNIWRAETSITTTGYYFLNSINFSGLDDHLSIAYATTGNYNGGKAPWAVSLWQANMDFFGTYVTAPYVAETYTVPATDASTKAIFSFHYDDVLLSPSETGLFWTAPATAGYADDQTVLNFAGFDAIGGTQTAATIQLQVNGTTAPVKNLYDVAFGVGASFGSGFTVAYSTFDPKSKAVQFKYEHFNDAGTPLNGGVLASLNDGYAHGVDFATYDPYNSSYQTPSFALLYRLPVGITAALHVMILSADGATTRSAFDILDYGPNGENSSGIENYGFTGRSATDQLQQYGIFTQTFFYTDSNSVVHEQVGIETVTGFTATTATIGARTQFSIANFNATGVGIARVLNGNFVVAYSDGGQTYLREYTPGLAQIGATFAVPDDNYGFSNLVSLGDGRVLLEWRQSGTGTYTQHNIIYDTRQTGLAITPATTAPDVAGTVFNDTVNQVGASQTVDGGGGADTFAVAYGLAQSTLSVDVGGAIAVTTPLGTDQLRRFTTVQFTDATLSIPAGTTTTGTDATSASALTIGHAGTVLTVTKSIAYGGSVTLNGAVSVNLGGYLLLSGTASFAGATVNGANRLYAEGTTTISGLTIGGTAVFETTKTATQSGGTVTLGDASGGAAILYNYGTGTYIIGDASGIARGNSASYILNQGRFEKTSTSGVSIISASIVDTGTIAVAGGNLRFDGPSSSLSGTYVGPGMFDYGPDGVATLGTLAMTSGACTTDFGTVNQRGTVTAADGSTIRTVAAASWTLAADVGLALAAGSSTPLFTNLGTLQKTGGTGTSTVGIDVTDSGTVAARSGTLAFTGPLNSFAGAITGTGTVAFAGGSTVLNSGTTLGVAHLQLSGSATTVTIGTNLTDANAFAAGAGATLKLTGGYLLLSGATTLSGVTVTGSQRLYAEGATTISGLTIGGTAVVETTKAVTQAGGAVTVGDATSSAAILYTYGGSTYSITDDSSIARGTSAGSYILDQGILQKTGGTGTSTIGTNIANNVSTAGTVGVSSGTLDLGGTLSGNLALKVGAGSTLILEKSAAAGAAAAFTGSNATLQLGDAQDYHGTIAGFAGTETLDLRSIGYTGAGDTPGYGGNTTAGTLTVTDGTHTASLAMVGNYTPTNFHLASDGHSGTAVTFV